jgi:hypothetical protein
LLLFEWNGLTVREWPHRKQFLPERKNIANDPLVDGQKHFIPSLHIRLGQLENFMEVMNRNGRGFRYLVQQFPWINGAKKIDPQMKDLMDDRILYESLGKKRNDSLGRIQIGCSQLSGQTQSVKL